MLCALACTGKTPCHSRPESAKRCAQNVTFYEQKVITKVLILCHHVTQITPDLCPRQADPEDRCAGHTEVIYDPVAYHVLSALHESMMIHAVSLCTRGVYMHSMLCTTA